ncbi:MAG: putative metalloprotease CJM1_0395 family protein [Arcobacteraceae bacterium]
MDIITDQYENISVNQLYAKLSAKYEQLNKVEETQKVENNRTKDYIDTSSIDKNYDEIDFARVVEKFRKKDAEIRTHEQVHASIGNTTTPISYSYQQGPDGKMYAIGGSVRFDTSIPNDPKAASFKLDMLQKAAAGPAQMSGADGSIASQSNLNKILLDLKGENDGNN